MSSKLIVLTGKELIKFLEYLGFLEIRINGSHHRLRHADGRITTVPVHGNDSIAKGLLRKIIRDDLLMDLDTFNELFENYQN